MQAFVQGGLFAVQRSAAVKVNSTRVRVTMSGEKSPSLPFLTKQANLTADMPGYVGFDPLGLSNMLPVEWLQEAEIKNGRVAMLAVIGLIVQCVVHLPGEPFTKTLPAEVFASVPSGGLWQIFLFCGLIEFISHKGKMTPVDMHEGGRIPGAFGFDPLGLGKSEAAFKRYQANEVKNGRLAMCAVGGLIHHAWLTGQNPLEQIVAVKFPY
mmetsp:Transcript_2434/g.4208  ORF Transcript_2434/g.4208 Transcript_2434/m.4208 type:complete len:210 (-) Transcript_2434:67-696(-)